MQQDPNWWRNTQFKSQNPPPKVDKTDIVSMQAPEFMPDEDKSALSEPGFVGLSRISICNKGSSDDDFESKSAPKQSEKPELRTISKAKSQPRVVSKNEEKKQKKK